MKNINYVVNGVLAVAVIILFVMQFSGKKSTSAVPAATVGEGAGNLLPIAYVNVDSLLQNYNYSKELNEQIVRMQEDYRADISQKTKALDNEVADFQRKYENNAFLTQERMQQESNRLQKKGAELRAYAEKREQELAQKQMEMNTQLRDTIIAHLRVFNESRGFEVILSNTVGDNILLSNPAYDITAEFVDALNKSYVSK